MDITPLVNADAQIIQSYAQGYFRVSGKVYEGPVIVFPDHVEDWKLANQIDELAAQDFIQLEDIKDQLDVVLLGTGPKFTPLHDALRKELNAKNINIEVMDSGAACRTYNVLLAEDRQVAALLYPYS